MPKPTYKQVIAIEYCEKYIDFSTRAIARLLIKDHPLDLPNQMHVQWCKGLEMKARAERVFLKVEIPKLKNNL